MKIKNSTKNQNAILPKYRKYRLYINIKCKFRVNKGSKRSITHLNKLHPMSLENSY